MGTLITSSPTTLRWLNKIKSKIKEKLPSLIYHESKYWASFKSPETNRNIVYFQPQKSQIRLLTRLDLSFDNVLKPTPASSGWAKMYPSIFLIKSENLIDKAIELIVSSYEKKGKFINPFLVLERMNPDNADYEDEFFEGSLEEDESEKKTEHIPPDKRKVYHTSPTRKIKDLYSDYKCGNLEVRPSFQRGYVWDTKKASRLIESIMLNVPIPMVYTSELPDGKEMVVDGQQRLLSIFSFIDGIFPNTDKPFRLRSLEVNTDLNGKLFKELGTATKNSVLNYPIPFTILTKDSDEEIKFDIFERLNTGSVKLNDQELRNCIYRGKYNDLLKELSENKDFQFILDNPRLCERMLDRELILRFFAYYHTDYVRYRSPMKVFLNIEMMKYPKLNDQEVQKLKDAFKKSVELVKTVFGNKAFRRFIAGDSRDPNGRYELKKINKGLFDIIMHGFTMYEKHQVIPHLDALREELLWLSNNDIEFIDSITGTGTDSTQKVQRKFEIWRNSLRTILGYQEKEPRGFSSNLKRQLMDNNPTCGICDQMIMTVDDAELDHIEFYWRGGKTISSNARLVHRYCNRSRNYRGGFYSDIKDGHEVLLSTLFSTGHIKKRGGTSQEEYMFPILKVLDQLGGKASKQKVIDEVGEMMKNTLNDIDTEVLSSGSIRWHSNIALQRQRMVKEGLISADSEWGVWELTEKGRTYLKAHHSD